MADTDGTHSSLSVDLFVFFPLPLFVFSPISLLAGTFSMSGLNAVQQLPDASQVSVTAPAEDPAASLRAAALKTLKAKRRKGPDGTDGPSSLPTRLPSTSSPSIQLDYGSEDPYGKSPSVSIAAPTVSSPATVQQPPPPPPPALASMDVDEDQTREEGEISDSESMPPPKSPEVSRQAPPPAPSVSVKQSLKERPMPPPIVPPSPSVSNVSVKTEASTHVLPDPPSSSPSLSRYSPVVDYDMYAVDEDHVRPGLASQCLSVIIFENVDLSDS